MKILFIRTDTENAIIGVLGNGKLAKKEWLAGRELSKTILTVVEEVLEQSGIKKNEIEGVLLYKGPGSFTGLRIGAAVANTFALALNVPIVSENGEQWIKAGAERLARNENENIAQIEYGGKANITKPRK